jgi:CheY-like chemotaxis protein
MEFAEFESIVKFGLSNLYDFAALETHPQLALLFPPPPSFSGNRGDYLRGLFLETIASFKPKDTPINLNAPEWRTCMILTKRYVDSLSVQEIAKQLSLSERQLRRYMHKAIHAFSLILWDRVADLISSTSAASPELLNSTGFIINPEEVDLDELVNGVVQLLSSRFQEEQITVQFDSLRPSFYVESDRVILRQILIGLVNQLLQSHIRDLTFSTTLEDDQAILVLSSSSFSGEPLSKSMLNEDQEKSIPYWSKELNILLEEHCQPQTTTIDLLLRFPASQQKVILIVDDQEPALRMFTRYLSRTHFKIVGLTKTNKVLMKAKELQPVLILLDIMMPKVDGWELFQSLKLDDSTKHIPVIICSAWGEPELAKSLGATGFLRKPVTQRDLLSTIQSLGILD